MHTKLKNRIINVITFVTHLLIAVSFVLLGWFGIAWNHAWHGSEDLTISYFMIIAGFVLFIVNFFILINNTFKIFIIPILIALISMILWIGIEGSMDVSNFLPIYLIIFTPLSFYKYKLNKNLHHTKPIIGKR